MPGRRGGGKEKGYGKGKDGKPRGPWRGRNLVHAELPSETDDEDNEYDEVIIYNHNTKRSLSFDIEHFYEKTDLSTINIDHYTYGDFHMNHIILPLFDHSKDNC